ncbi:urea ABC transporter permease subunit UrtB [Stappia sp. ES.058]|uniref:urea ABC transporter permease subunit UrtB n=1 Tax=Stappia sp. ES.058 TaxID=1881061 RepID=UPI000879AFCF|nr:urea ABC transporter permease subunit UrtB [Stappia sp. ES.058]SDU34007.1 amino acid/amide ABC transporter membrane protein 1, HAAT family [Stappia sp. ES.058]
MPIRPRRDFAALRALAICLALAFLTALSAGTARAQTADELLSAQLNALASGGFDETQQQVNALATTGDPRAAPALEALAEGDLYFRRADNVVFIVRKEGRDYALTDPITLEEAGTAGRREVKKIRVNNRLRRVIRTALGTLTLRAPDPAARLEAADAIFKAQDVDSIEPLDAALEAETDETVARHMRQARAAAVLASDRPTPDKLDAIATVAARGDRDARSLLTSISDGPDTALHEAANAAIAKVERVQGLWDMARNIWFGLSLGSVLLLAAIGLAITFGVMGVINMAHGEMVMLGAYTTFVVQSLFRTAAPEYFDYSLIVALPAAFLVAGLVGIAIERGIIRFLHDRPLETLLATWGVSLILQQTVRTIFGPTNQEVGNPAFMSGAMEIGQLTITYNRLWIVVFALVVFTALLVAMKATRFGLYVRAVTQNRRMSASMGIRTPLVDALTFGLGSGIAGIAGVALSQIDNVSPNLGQSYIIDSFMVVVFGGVGNLWGTLLGAFTLGIANKFLEPFAGAVLAKILVLVFIILFIQKRPRGLFALKGRAVDA